MSFTTTQGPNISHYFESYGEEWKLYLGNGRKRRATDQQWGVEDTPSYGPRREQGEDAWQQLNIPTVREANIDRRD